MIGMLKFRMKRIRENINKPYVRKPGRPQTRKSLTINPFKKHPREKITSRPILFWEGETMGPGAKIIVGGRAVRRPRRAAAADNVWAPPPAARKGGGAAAACV